MKTDYKHFEIQEITEGVWGATSKSGGSHLSNSGIIDLGEETLIFDTGLSLESAADLKNAALDLTGRIPDVIVNSHFHSDHFWGNQVFPEARVITSEENVKVNEPHWKQAAEQSYHWAKGEIEEARKLFDSESEYDREYARVFTGFLSGIIETAPSLTYKTPDITFDDDLELTGSKRSAEVIEYKNGHSQSDCVLHLSADKILFTGDLCYIDFHPCLDFGDPLNTINIMGQLKELKAETVVPGHGSLGNSSAFDSMKEYIQTLLDLVEVVVSNGGSQGEAESIAVPEKYLDFQMRDFFYKRNLSCLYRILSS